MTPAVHRDFETDRHNIWFAKNSERETNPADTTYWPPLENSYCRLPSTRLNAWAACRRRNVVGAGDVDEGKRNAHNGRPPNGTPPPPPLADTMQAMHQCLAVANDASSALNLDAFDAMQSLTGYPGQIGDYDQCAKVCFVLRTLLCLVCMRNTRR